MNNSLQKLGVTSRHEHSNEFIDIQVVKNFAIIHCGL